VVQGLKFRTVKSKPTWSVTSYLESIVLHNKNVTLISELTQVTSSG